MRRIKIIGDPGAVSSIGVLENYLLSTGFSVDFPEEAVPDLIIHLDHHSHPYALIYMRQESNIAPLILRELSRMQLAQVMIDWRDRNAGNHVKIVFNPADSQKIEMGLVNACSLTYAPAPVLIKPKSVPWWKKLLPMAMLLASMGEAQAQVNPICLWDTVNNRCVGAGDFTSRTMRITCISGCGGASPFEDRDTFVAGTTSIGNIGAVFDDALADLTAGMAGAPRLTAKRALHNNIRTAAGVEVPFPAALAGGGGFKVECLSGCGSPPTFADASAFSFGVTSVGNIGCVVDDTGTNTIAENSAGAPRCNTNRILLFRLTNDAGTEIGTAGAPLRIDPTGTTPQPVTQSGVWTVQPGNTANTTPWLIDIDQTGPNNDVDVVSSTLPTGAATEATLATRASEATLTALTVDHDVANTLKTQQIGGNASPVKTTPTGVTAGDRVRAWYDQYGRAVVTSRKLATYRCVFRLGTVTAEAALTFTHVANTGKQYATIYHAASAVKLVKIRRVYSWIYNVATAAGIFFTELHRLSATTAPATGNPVITPMALNPADAAAETTCLALPTTAGSEATPLSTFASIRKDYGLTTAAPTGNPLQNMIPDVLWEDTNTVDEDDFLSMRNNVAEGYAVIIRSSAASVTRAMIMIEFTEETP